VFAIAVMIALCEAARSRSSVCRTSTNLATELLTSAVATCIVTSSLCGSCESLQDTDGDAFGFLCRFLGDNDFCPTERALLDSLTLAICASNSAICWPAASSWPFFSRS
jgi:hypothetical protein